MRTRANTVAGRAGWSLLELVLVLGILSVLTCLLLCATQRARDSAARLSCANRLRQVALGVHGYSASHGHLPAGCDYSFGVTKNSGTTPGLSWHTAILPHVEQNALWRQAMHAYRQDSSGDSSLHEEVGGAPVQVFMCPSLPRLVDVAPAGHSRGLTSYLGVAGTGYNRDDGLFHKHIRVRFTDITDGTSTTLMVGERPPAPHGDFSTWYSTWGSAVCPLTQILSAGHTGLEISGGVGCLPFSGPLRPGSLSDLCDLNHYWSIHTGGANFAFADGSVRFVSYRSSSVLPALATRAGKEQATLD